MSRPDPGSLETFEFFELVRRLQSKSGRGDAVRVGTSASPAREAVRFQSALDFSFGVRDVEAVTWDAERQRHNVVARFLSLYGTGSPLPACYTELLLYEDPEGRLRAFLDIFNHRLLSFLYRAWEKYRQVVQSDVAANDPITRRLRLLCHLEQPSDPVELLSFAGLLHRQPLSEASLERLLSVYLSVPVTVQSCVMRWFPVPTHQQMSLGRANCSLGGMAVLGRELRSASTTFGVHVGPLDYAEYLQFLPGGKRRALLLALLERLDADNLDCELVIEVDPCTMSPYRLGMEAGGLGLTSWVGDEVAQFAPKLGATSSRILVCFNSEVRVA